MEAIRLNSFDRQRITDSEIVKRVLAGEKELYEILLRRNNQKLYRVIRSYINSQADIEDLMQNTYLKAYEKLYQFKHTAVFSTWLIRIGINEALAKIKDRKKGHSELDQDTVIKMPDTHRPNPEKNVIQKEASALLEQTIDTLDEKYKVVYLLREVEEMKMQEIAECLDISVSNVKVRLHRAKSLLKEKLFKAVENSSIYEFGFSRCDRIVENVMSQI